MANDMRRLSPFGEIAHARRSNLRKAMIVMSLYPRCSAAVEDRAHGLGGATVLFRRIDR